MTPLPEKEETPPTPGKAAVWATVATLSVTILVWLLRDMAGIEVPADVQGAMTGIAAAVAGYKKSGGAP